MTKVIGMKRFTVNLYGKQRHWSLNIYATDSEVARMKEDGLEVYEIRNTYPAWVAQFRLTRAWSFAQDVFYFRNPFS